LTQGTAVRSVELPTHPASHPVVELTVRVTGIDLPAAPGALT
jgi:hypothetical protein